MLVRVDEAAQRGTLHEDHISAFRMPCHHHAMRYADREEAGNRLAAAIVRVVPGPAVVLGIPRGGVIVAVPVARALRRPARRGRAEQGGRPVQPRAGARRRGTGGPLPRRDADRAARRLRRLPGRARSRVAEAEIGAPHRCVPRRPAGDWSWRGAPP